MLIYLKVLENGTPLPGAPGTYQNGMEILGISWGGPTLAPGVREIVITTKLGSAPPGLARHLTSGHKFTLERHFDPASHTAQLNFTRAGPGAGEIIDLRVQLHRVRIMRIARAVLPGRPTPVDRIHASQLFQLASVLPGRPTPVDRIVLRYSRMTHASAPESAPDVSHQARARAAHEAGVDVTGHPS